MAGPEIQVRFPDNRNPEVAGQSGVRTGWTTDVLGHDAVQVTHPLEPSGEYAERECKKSALCGQARLRPLA
jgi:hypothetical protein